MKRILAALLAILLVAGLVVPAAAVRGAEGAPTSTVAPSTDATVRSVSLLPAPGGVPVLIIKYNDPWGYDTYLSFMVSLGYAPTLADWSEIGTTVQMSSFRYIYIPSVQYGSFYTTYAARMAEIEAWVAAGGRLLVSGCTQGAVFSIPGGGAQQPALQANNVIVDSHHPIVTGTLSDDIALTDGDLFANYCSHNHFTTLPAAAHIILQDTAGYPTLAEYDYGSGHIVASGLTWEFYCANGEIGGLGAFAVRAYDDLLLYTFPLQRYTIKASASAGGTISPEGNVSVRQGTSRTFTITPSRGYVLSSVTVDGVSVGPVTTYTFTGVSTDHTIHASFRPLDAMAPIIELPDGAPQAAVGSPCTLHLLVTDDRSIADVGIYENGTRIGGSATGGDIRVPLSLADGRHTLVVVALDGSGQRTEKTVALTVDTHGPVLSLDLPASVTAAVLPVSGSAVDAVSGLKSLTIAGTPVTPFLDGSFKEQLTLTKGTNTIVVEAVDAVGNTTTETFTVTYKSKVSTAPVSISVVLTVGKTEMEVNGMACPLGAAPVIRNGRTLLPIRALMETLGGSADWKAATKTATVALGSRTVVLTIGSTRALVDGKLTTMDVAPVIIGGRTFLPLRFIAENLGLDLAWDAPTQTISFTYWP
jgi:hypothetical protein